MVFGLWMHKFGVGFRGDSGPNAPIVLGTKSFNLSANCCVELDVNEKLDISQAYIVCWARWHCGGLRCWPGRPGERSVHQPQTTGHWVEFFFSRQSNSNDDLRSKWWYFGKWKRKVPEVYEPINPMIDNNLLKTFEIEHIRKQEGTFIKELNENMAKNNC